MKIGSPAPANPLTNKAALKRGPDRAPLSRWILPFVAVALIVQVSAALPPDLRSSAWFAASCLVLTALTAVVILVPWQRLPDRLELLVPVGYLVSLLLLLGSQRSTAGGLQSLVLLPIVWAALYRRPAEAAAITLAAVATLLAVSLIHHETAEAIVRRSVLWGAMGGLVVVSVHNLRHRLGATIGEREEALRQARLLRSVAEELNATLDPELVVATAVRATAEIASLGKTHRRRASYLRIDGEAIEVTRELDGAGREGTKRWPIADHPHLQEAIRSGVPSSGPVCGPVCGPVGPAEIGPRRNGFVRSAEVEHCARVPVRAGASTHGVLLLGSREEPIQAEELALAVTLGHMLGMALGNALTHQRTARAANIDPLTGLANRRGLESLVTERRGRRALATLSIDVDGLKAVNDHDGHDAGDELLRCVARAIAAALRRGDVAARIGGDEFAAVVFDADARAAHGAAERLLDAVRGAAAGSLEPRLSVGVACGAPGVGLDQLLRQSDAAMYEAKRAGGMRYALAWHGGLPSAAGGRPPGGAEAPAVERSAALTG